MSLPSSESIPGDFDDLPPARQRHIRRRPRAASRLERGILLESLLHLTLPSLNFFLLGLLGSFALGAGLYYDEPVILIAGAVLLRLFDPLFGLALLPTALKWRTGFKFLVSLLVLILLTFSGGVLSGYLSKTASFDSIAPARFSSLFWLDISIVCGASILGGIVFVRSGTMPRLIGVLLAYEILVPVAVGGFGFPLGAQLLWPHALLSGLAYLITALACIMLTFLILGFSPNRSAGWLLFFVVLALAAGSQFGVFLLNGRTPTISQPLPPTETATLAPSPTHSRSSVPSLSPTSTPTTPSPTSTITPSLTATMTLTTTITETPQPTSFWAVIDSLNGAVIRESPKFDAPVVGYLDNAKSVEILEEILPDGSSIWYRVRTLEGTTGWLLGSLANSQTPTPMEN